MLYLLVAPVINESMPVVLAVESNNATFQCAAVSEPVHITDWLLNGNNIVNSSKYIISGINTVRSTLTVVNVSLADEGNYTCHVNNLHGRDAEAFVLQVQG